MRSFCGRPLRADRFIAGAAWLSLRIFLSCDVALIGRTEFDLIFVALHSGGAKPDSGVATEA